MIVDQIKNANIEAIKTKNSVARNIYSVVLNKIMLESIKLREKNVNLTDIEVIQILQKTIKELSDEQENYIKVNNTAEVENIQKQILIIKQYLPQMMSEQEIKDAISSLNDKSIPAVMKHFKSEYNGKCDMRLVSEVLKSI